MTRIYSVLVLREPMMLRTPANSNSSSVSLQSLSVTLFPSGVYMISLNLPSSQSKDFNQRRRVITYGKMSQFMTKPPWDSLPTTATA